MKMFYLQTESVNLKYKFVTISTSFRQTAKEVQCEEQCNREGHGATPSLTCVVKKKDSQCGGISFGWVRMIVQSPCEAA